MADGDASGQAPLGKKKRNEALTAGSIARYYSGSGEVAWESNFAIMLERAEIMSFASETCKACEGEGFRALSVDQLERWERKIAGEPDPDRRHDLREQLSYESTCAACRGVGTRPTRKWHSALNQDSMFTTVWCWRCRGGGSSCVYWYEPNDWTAEIGDVCLRCTARDETGKPLPGATGAGYTVPITVRSTGSSKTGKPPKRDPGGGVDLATSRWVDEDMLVERGRVGREIESIKRRNPVVGFAMDDYYGLLGDKWGSHKWGRLFSLWHHTDAGKLLAVESAERSYRGHGHLIHPLDLIATERDAEVRAMEPGNAHEGNPRRRALIAQADRQARGLLVLIERTVRETEAA